MNLPTQKFSDYLKSKFAINDVKLGLLNNLLQETGSIIAGGSVLSAYNDVFIPYYRGYNQCTPNLKHDFDLYIHLNKMEEFIRRLPEIFRDYRNNQVCSYTAPPYDKSFLKKNNILGRFVLKQYNYPDIDLIIVSNEKNLTDIVDSFDLSFCKIWYNGVDVQARNPEDILNKRGTLGSDYIKCLLNGNYFTAKRIQKYKKKGYKILVDLDYEFEIKEDENVIISPEDWVVSNIVKYFVFKMNRNTYTPLTLPINQFIRLNLNNYTMESLDESLTRLSYSPEAKKNIYMNTFENHTYPDEYFQYIFDITGITEDELNVPQQIVQNMSGDVEDDVEDDEDDFDDDDVFEESYLDERNIDFNTCRDLYMTDDIDITTHLNETDTFLFINSSGVNGVYDMFCFEKSYIRNILNNKNDNWFYECNGPIIPGTNDRRMTSFVDFPYIKIPIDTDGLTGFIPILKIQQILTSNKKVYYINPMLENGIQKMITHSVTWQNSLGPRNQMDLVSANHCQAGSSILVYTLKICKDAERCVRSIIAGV